MGLILYGNLNTAHFPALQPNSKNCGVMKLSTQRSRLRTLLSRFGTLLEAIFIFVLLASGIGVIFLGKLSGLIEAGMLLFSISLTVQIVAFFLLGFYLYIRFLRTRIRVE
jgi:hypothetical protein